jgi:hypothetical protein
MIPNTNIRKRSYEQNVEAVALDATTELGNLVLGTDVDTDGDGSVDDGGDDKGAPVPETGEGGVIGMDVDDDEGGIVPGVGVDGAEGNIPGVGVEGVEGDVTDTDIGVVGVGGVGGGGGMIGPFESSGIGVFASLTQ